ncbi:MAG TPA: hypothetical protein P5146_00775 [Desulfomonilia bacterium]|jgi:cell division protein FtsB|nr:hypothetical protein [Deltaproteobacteria bacterium]HQA70518.1 hypothetical protein [Deltaproteobacteria bacterium]HRR20321.1 hypothetical protein [Desulfomonilia bacterium]HRR67803.1 hypothetical protein [Desulfomonilia bacterium]HRT43855.1 hypothetical protein [Desulfomonilia bacterium]
MDGKRNRLIVPLTLAVLVFLAGLILGYSIWGSHRNEKVDYKQVLRDAVDYIVTLEHRNEKLSERVGALETELAVASQRQQENAEQRSGEIASLRQQLNALRDENLALRSRLQSLSQDADTGGVSPVPQQGSPGG